MNHGNKGFTLVELAIVITIIGLLIGGVLKGQELLENARMTSSASQIKSYDAAVNTFRDVYKAWPADMLEPQNYLQNCITAPCNIAGNGNGMIGVDSTNFTDESFNFWTHLAAANLVNGVTITTAIWNGSWIGQPSPNFPISAKLLPIYNSSMGGYYYHTVSVTNTLDIPVSTIGKYDVKMDDGKPTTGDVRAHVLCTLASGGLTYDPNIKTVCHMLVKAGF